MLKIVNTENLTGVTLSGTYDDIEEVYEAISNVLGPGEETLTSFRILGVCYDLRHCFMGDREVELIDNGYREDLRKYHGIIHPETNIHFKVSILWIEVIFAALALDDFVKRYRDDKTFNKMMKNAGLDDVQKLYFEESRFKDIALVKLFQEKVWEAFREACGSTAYKRLYKKAKEEDYHFVLVTKYSDYCTHYLDKLEMKYLHSKPEKREKLLATLTRKIIVLGDDYYSMDRDVSNYARENDIGKEEVRLANVEYPESIEW